MGTDAEQWRDIGGRSAYAELPGTQHNFDLFHSLRFHAVTDAVESYASRVHAGT